MAKMSWKTLKIGVESWHHFCAKISKWSVNDDFFNYLIKNERGFQKQPTIFQNKKRPVGSTKKLTLKRYLRTVGLGFKTPAEVMLEWGQLVLIMDLCMASLTCEPEL